MISRIYRNRLSYLQKKVYDVLVDGFTKMKPEIKVLCSDDGILDTIIEYIRLDYPWIFFLGKIEYFINPIWRYIVVVPTYIYSEQQADNLKTQLCIEQKKLITKVSGKSVWDKLLCVHDNLCHSLEYRQIGFDSHSIIGPYIRKQSVCEGIAKSFKDICDCLDIESCIVIGKSKPSFDANFYEDHSWNQVNIDGDWVNIDTTFDLTLSAKNFIRHDYFCVPDNQIIKSHTKTKDNGIACETTRFDYFTVNGLLMRTQTHFVKFVQFKIEQGVSAFEVKLPSTGDIFSVENKIFTNMQKALEMLGVNKSFEISVNKDMLVVLVRIL